MRLVLFVSLVFTSCGASKYSLPAFAGQNSIHVVIEIPAGTSLKYEYDTNKNGFVVEQLINGDKREIKFLPYPGNYGFIPSTKMAENEGGDGDALDVLVLCSTLKRGSVIRAIPVALLKMIDQGKLDYKIIAVPEDAGLRNINCTTLACLQENYPAALTIIELWFTHYKANTGQIVEGWVDDQAAIQEINKWIK